MKFKDIIESASSGSTSSGSVAPVASTLGSTKSRNPSIYGGGKAGTYYQVREQKANMPIL